MALMVWELRPSGGFVPLVDLSDEAAGENMAANGWGPGVGWGFNGRVYGEAFVPPRLTPLFDRQHRGMVVSDCPMWGDTSAPLLSRRAVEALRDMLEPNGELLPVICDYEEFWIFNTTRLLDALDEAESELRRFPSSGRIMKIERYELLADQLGECPIFKLTLDAHGRALVTKEFIDRVNQSALVGFSFCPIWTSARQS